MLLGRFGRVMVLAAVVVIAGLGLCLLDADDFARGGLCPSSFATPGNLLVLGIPLALMGCLVPGFALAYHRYPPDLPAPPPKV